MRTKPLYGLLMMMVMVAEPREDLQAEGRTARGGFPQPLDQLSTTMCRYHATKQ
jgi:hypothetical protein